MFLFFNLILFPSQTSLVTLLQNRPWWPVDAPGGLSPPESPVVACYHQNSPWWPVTTVGPKRARLTPPLSPFPRIPSGRLSGFRPGRLGEFIGRVKTEVCDRNKARLNFFFVGENNHFGHPQNHLLAIHKITFRPIKPLHTHRRKQ